MKKKTLKNELTESITGKVNEIRFSPFQNTEGDLIQGLNWYACNATTNDLRLWALKWAAENQPEIALKLEKVSPDWFSTWGALCRLHSRGFSLSEKHVQKIKDKFVLLANTKAEKEEVAPVVKKDKPKPEKRANKTLLALDMGVDTILTGKTPPRVSIDSTDDLNEVIEAIESYQADAEHDKNKPLLKFLEDTLVAARGCKQAKKQVHRKRKINPVKMVSKVKYLKTHEKIQGLTPLDIIGKKKVYVYDTKRRVLICYSAIPSGFVWKGTTLLNLEEDKCQSKIIRKPEEFLSELDKSISALNATWKEIKSKPREIVGRFNSNMILLNAS